MQNYFSKYSFFQFLLVAILITIGNFTLLSQKGGNPFEIEPRLSNLPVDTNTFVQKDTIGQNLLQSDSAVNIDKLKQEGIDKIRTVYGDNPYEVDHLPIRKSSLHKQSTQFQNQIKATNTNHSFLFWFLLFTCTILAIILNTQAKAVGLLYKSIVNENILKLYYREESKKNSFYLLILYSIFVINAGVFIFLILKNAGKDIGLKELMVIIVAVALVYIVKHLGLYLIGNIFKISKNTQLYSFTIMIFNVFLGITLILFNFLIAFGPGNLGAFLIWVVLIIIAILVLLRTIRGLFIASEFFIDKLFQIFVYLCAFEIAPLAILVKSIFAFGL